MIKKFFLTIIFSALTIASCFAQGDMGPPCDYTDGDAFCPLDTWVIALAMAAFAVTVVHLYRKQKSIQA